MAQTSYPESSPGPIVQTTCCGSTIQSLHRYHVDRRRCGKRANTGGGVQPRILPGQADTDSASESS
jgi:hypothetical protein